MSLIYFYRKFFSFFLPITGAHNIDKTTTIAAAIIPRTPTVIAAKAPVTAVKVPAAATPKVVVAARVHVVHKPNGKDTAAIQMDNSMHIFFFFLYYM